MSAFNDELSAGLIVVNLIELFEEEVIESLIIIGFFVEGLEGFIELTSGFDIEGASIIVNRGGGVILFGFVRFCECDVDIELLIRIIDSEELTVEEINVLFVEVQLSVKREEGLNGFEISIIDVDEFFEVFDAFFIIFEGIERDIGALEEEYLLLRRVVGEISEFFADMEESLRIRIAFIDTFEFMEGIEVFGINFSDVEENGFSILIVIEFFDVEIRELEVDVKLRIGVTGVFESDVVGADEFVPETEFRGDIFEIRENLGIGIIERDRFVVCLEGSTLVVVDVELELCDAFVEHDGIGVVFSDVNFGFEEFNELGIFVAFNVDRLKEFSDIIRESFVVEEGFDGADSVIVIVFIPQDLFEELEGFDGFGFFFELSEFEADIVNGLMSGVDAFLKDIGEFFMIAVEPIETM